MDDIEKSEAVQLFLHRARAVKPDFQFTEENALALAEICRRLDGLPLAIELAAARCRLLTPHRMLQQLGSRLSLLVGGASDLPERHHTMHTAIDWSYKLLSFEEQILFRRLSVFAGGCFPEAAEVVCGFDGIDVLAGLESLLDMNLIRQSETKEEPRLWMYETIREYGLAMLEASGEGDFLRRRHAHYYIVFANRFTQELNRLATELDNLRSILRWSIDSGSVDLGYRILNHILFWANWASEGRRWLAELLAFPGPPSHAMRRGYAIFSAGQLAIWQGDFDAGRVEMNNLQTLAKNLNSPALHYLAQFGIGYILIAEDQLAEALNILSELEKNKEAGVDWWLMPWIYFALTTIMVLSEDYDKAKDYLQAAADIFKDHNQTVGVSRCIIKRGFIALAQGDFPEAGFRFYEGIELANKFGMQRTIASCILGFAGIALGRGDLGRAARLFGAAEALIKITGSIYHDPYEEATNKRNLTKLRSWMDERIFATAWAEGEQMDLEEVIAYALEGTQPGIGSDD
jgi:non-specific serine/threonine protein kinase